MRMIRRTYFCEGCGSYFKTFDFEPPCPKCGGAPEPPTPPARSDLPVAAAILGERTKLQDGITRSMMAEHGLTDMRDNQREGDVAAPPLQGTARQMAQMMEKKGGFWQNSAPGPVDGLLSQHGGGVNQGIPKDHAMRVMQNTARRAEGA